MGSVNRDHIDLCAELAASKLAGVNRPSAYHARAEVAAANLL